MNNRNCISFSLHISEQSITSTFQKSSVYFSMQNYFKIIFGSRLKSLLSMRAALLATASAFVIAPRPFSRSLDGEDQRSRRQLPPGILEPRVATYVSHAPPTSATVLTSGVGATLALAVYAARCRNKIDLTSSHSREFELVSVSTLNPDGRLRLHRCEVRLLGPMALLVSGALAGCRSHAAPRGVRRRPGPYMALRTFSAAEYASILERRSVTATTFANLPLAEMPGAPRGRLLTTLAREVDAALHPGALFEEAEAGRDVNGKRRGQNMAPYDWQRDGQRVACKSSQLVWDTSRRRWKLQFKNVKLGGEGTEAAFDELLLAAYTPRGI